MYVQTGNALPESHPSRQGWTGVPCTGALQAVRRATASAKMQLRRGPGGPLRKYGW